MTLTVVIAALNAETDLRRCLESASFADETVVVVDDRSTDSTEQEARKVTEKVYRRKLDNFANQKNFGISKADSDWILILDADERVTSALEKEIRTAMKDPTNTAYRIPVINFLLGKRMAHGGWSDKLIRLIKRSEAHYHGDIHETFSPKGPVGELRGEIWHFSHRDITELLGKAISYGDIQAAYMAKQGHPPVTRLTFAKVVLKAVWFRLVRKRGYRDGAEGVIEGLFQPFALFCAYVFLWQQQQSEPLPDRYERLEQELKRQR